MINTIVWNVRGINTQGVMERIRIFKRIYHLAIISIPEPFADSSIVMIFKKQLGMDNVIANCNGKIWLFWNRNVDCMVKDQDDQQNNCDINHNELQKQFTMTFVYAKCKKYLRRPLWDKMLLQDEVEDTPWCSVGDYNVITSTEEKLGVITYNIRKSLDFIAIIEACVLIDMGFTGKNTLGPIIGALIRGSAKGLTEGR